MDVLKKKSELEQKFGIKILYLIEAGSKLHGTSTKNSDLDLKGVYISSLENIILRKNVDEIQEKTAELGQSNTADDIDIQLLSLEKFMGYLNLGEANAMMMLFAGDSPSVLFISEEFKKIYDKRSMFITRNFRPFTGFALKQVSMYLQKGERIKALDEIITVFSKYEKQMGKRRISEVIIDNQPLEKILLDQLEGEHFKLKVTPTERYFTVLNRDLQINAQIKYVLKQLQGIRDIYGKRSVAAACNDGKDYKAFSHAFRALLEFEELMLTGDLKYPLAKADFLLKVKQGYFSDKEKLSEMLDDKFDEIIQLSDKNTNFPEKLEIDERDNIIKEIYKIKEDVWTFGLEH